MAEILRTAEPQHAQTSWAKGADGEPRCPFCGNEVEDLSVSEPIVLRCKALGCKWRWDD